MLGADSIALVLRELRSERTALEGLLEGLSHEQWELSTECPLYSVKGVATHILGDDLSLLSRQRDRAENGLFQLAGELAGADFRTLLDTFNDRWVSAARFLSVELVIPTEDDAQWTIGPVALGPAQQAADILTRGCTADEIRRLVSGPAEAVDRVASFAGRP